MIVVRLNHPLTHAAAKAFMALAFVFGVQTAQATALSDLLVPGATLHVGDLTFSDFTYHSTANAGGNFDQRCGVRECWFVISGCLLGHSCRQLR